MERSFHRHWGNGGADLAPLGQAALLMEALTSRLYGGIVAMFVMLMRLGLFIPAMAVISTFVA